MNKYQLFAEEEIIETGEPVSYTQEAVDKLLAEQKASMEQAFDDKFNRKFAEYKQKSKEEADEAARLASMDAKERAEAERDKLQRELDELKAANNRSQMVSESRRILSDRGVNVPDDIINRLVAADAEETQKAVNSFADLFNNEIEKQVKTVLSGRTPRASVESTLTKADIMAVKDRVQRQRLIAEHPELF